MDTKLPMGPLMMDLQGESILDNEKTLLRHPGVGGVILFTRNFSDLQQVRSLVREIRALRGKNFLVAVDQEGGRVQRFREGFTRLPAAGRFAPGSEGDPALLRKLTESVGWIMASELRAVDIDFSFAPVLDVDCGISTVIGDRSFARTPELVAECASGFRDGMLRAGMPAVGKHFPGHGGVALDSHLALPVDDRALDALMKHDVEPFRILIEQGLEGIMPAHVVYSEADTQPAGFSPFWLQTVLRGQLGFDGVIFSDDLSMAGAEVAGTYPERARLALDAGCDMVLVCNAPGAAETVVELAAECSTPERQRRLLKMCGRAAQGDAVADNVRREQALEAVNRVLG